MKKNKTSREVIFDLWKHQKWISNVDFAAATGGSPKLTTRISELRRSGVPIMKQIVINEETGKRHAEYALIEE